MDRIWLLLQAVDGARICSEVVCLRKEQPCSQGVHSDDIVLQGWLWASCVVSAAHAAGTVHGAAAAAASAVLLTLTLDCCVWHLGTRDSLC